MKLVSLFFLVASLASASTQIRLAQLGACFGSITPVIVALIPGPTAEFKCLPIDNITIKIDASGKLVAVGGAAAGPIFVDGVPPAGLMDGNNLVFTLVNALGQQSAPNPVASLKIFLNGLLLCTGVTCRGGADYALSGVTVTFVAGRAPQAGDQFMAYFRQ